MRKPLNDSAAESAIREGRRLYVGNMPYQATTEDVEKLFSTLSSQITGINMSVDPLTGRNPSYCFVDFKSADLAQRVIEQFSGQVFMGRPLKVRPGVRSQLAESRQDADGSHGSHDANPLFQDRWKNPASQSALAAINHAGEEGRRVYVGGLPRFRDQYETEKEIRNFFGAVKPKLVGKLITPHESKLTLDGNHHFSFVDFDTREDAETAVAQMNGKVAFGGPVMVRPAKGVSQKLDERRRLYVGGLPEFESQEVLEGAMQWLFKGYEISSVSKLLSPSTPRTEEGNWMFCFVEVKNGEQADAAIAALDVS